MKTPGHKIILLRIYQILLENTDESHPMNSTRLKEELSKYDIEIERRTIYKDIAAMQEADIDIVSSEKGYYIASRSFELPELKLLADAVSASKFISEKKSRDLLKKLEGLASKGDAHQIIRQVVVPDRVKTDNEKIFYSIDVVYQCIEQNTQMSFQYEEWTIHKTKELRRGGKRYLVSPAFLIRNDENYYLVAYDEERQQIRHYRMDKIVGAMVENAPRGGAEARKALVPEEYAKDHIGMFSGNESVVTLKCQKALAGVLLDKFGSDISIRSDAEDYIKARIKVSISPQFYGWITGLGAVITAPEQEKEKYMLYLQEQIEKMK